MILCQLSIAQHMAPGDEISPGFHIESKWITALAEVGGGIDVDRLSVSTGRIDAETRRRNPRETLTGMPRAERARRLEAFAVGGFQLRAHQWRPYRGLGPILLTDSGICWVQRWPRLMSKLHPLVKWAPTPVFIPIEGIRSVRFTDNSWAPALNIQTDEGFYDFRIGRGWLTRSARRIARDWSVEIEARLSIERDRRLTDSEEPRAER